MERKHGLFSCFCQECIEYDLVRGFPQKEDKIIYLEALERFLLTRRSRKRYGNQKAKR